MDGETTQRERAGAATDGMSGDPVVVRRSGQGWQVGPEQTADLTSAMVLADLLAADLGGPGPATGPPAGPNSHGDQGDEGDQGDQGGEAGEAARLAVTVAQLEHALVARIRVEQAIGVLAERHRLRPRQAFDLLRNVARARGQKVTGLAEAVVDSTSNPLLPLPGELARQQLPPRQRGRSPRHAHAPGGSGGMGSPREKTAENVAGKR
jgi:hypothetical protein